MDWQRGDVDGVPVFWSRHADNRPGELAMGLIFRVGLADEPLARRGITHLIEHLALHGIGQPLDHVNGEVGATTTTFYRRGSAEEAVSFVHAVCRALRNLPADRIPAEVQVLRTEAAGRSTGPTGPLLIWRYGAHNYGLPGYPEYGLGHQSPDDLRIWADYWFTKGNAALWVVGGPPPEDLRIDLPDGPRIPVPTASNALPRTPAFFNQRVKGVGLISVVGRAVAPSVYARALRSRLHRTLRTELGISYSPLASYEARDASSAHVIAFADGLTEVGDQLLGGFTRVLDELAETAMPAAELAELITPIRELIDPGDAGTIANVTINAAIAELVGHPAITAAEHDAVLRRLTPEDVCAVATTARDGALLMIPTNLRPKGTRYSAAPTGSPGTVDGHVLAPVGPEHVKLIVGPFGVSRVEGITFATVKYAECQLMAAWPDGSRLLIGPDGVQVHVDPREWQGGHIAPGIIDANVPPAVVVVQPGTEHTPAAPAAEPVAAQPQQQRRGLFRRR